MFLKKILALLLYRLINFKSPITNFVNIMLNLSEVKFLNIRIILNISNFNFTLSDIKIKQSINDLHYLIRKRKLK